MKKLFLFLAASLVFALAHAGADDIVFTKRNNTDTLQNPTTPLHNTSGIGALMYDSASTATSPRWTIIGTAVYADVPASGNAAAGEVVIGTDSRLSDSRVPLAHTQSASTISDSTAVGRSVLTAVDAGAARSAIGAGTSSFSGAYSALSGLPTTLSAAGITDAYPLMGNPSGFLTSITGGQVTTALGFTPYNGATNPNAYVTSSGLTTALVPYAPTSALTSGLAGKFNTPGGTSAQCVRGDGSVGVCPGSSGTVTSVAVSSSNLTVTGSPITASGTIAVSLPSVGTADTYSGVTTDAQGRVTAGTKRSISFLTKALNTCFQVSSTRDSDVLYNAEVNASAALVGGQRGTIYLETFTDSACTLNIVEVMRQTIGNTNALIVALGNVSVGTLTVQGPISGGLYAKIRTESNTGTPTFTARPGWEKMN